MAERSFFMTFFWCSWSCSFPKHIWPISGLNIPTCLVMMQIFVYVKRKWTKCTDSSRDSDHSKQTNGLKKPKDSNLQDISMFTTETASQCCYPCYELLVLLYSCTEAWVFPFALDVLSFWTSFAFVHEVNMVIKGNSDSEMYPLGQTSYHFKWSLHEQKEQVL